MLRNLLLAVCLLASTLHAAEQITDTATLTAVLQAVFPGLPVKLLPGKRIDKTWQHKTKYPLVFPDALKADPVFVVTGRYTEDAERCASENAAQEQLATQREVRLRLYRLPGNVARAVGVLQYRFIGSSPAGSCQSLGRVLLMECQAHWRQLDRYDLEPMHHFVLTGIRWTDTGRDGSEELLIDSQAGGAGVIASELTILRIGPDKLEPLMQVVSRLSGGAEESEQYTQQLDLAATHRERGNRYCFIKKVYQRQDRWLPRPAVSRPCYPPGEGLEPAIQ